MNVFFLMQQQNSILRAVISIIIGVILIFVPNFTLIYLITLIGSILLILGGVSIISYYTKKNESEQKRLIPYGAIIGCAIGLALIIKPVVFVNLFTIFLGIILLLGGIGQLMSLTIFKRYTQISPVMYVTPILVLICGIVLLINPFSSALTIVIVFGISILIYGVLELISYFKFKNIDKNIDKNTDKNTDETKPKQ